MDGGVSMVVDHGCACRYECCQQEPLAGVVEQRFLKKMLKTSSEQCNVLCNPFNNKNVFFN